MLSSWWRYQVAPGPRQPRGIRVGLITPGSIADAAWNSGAYQGLEQIRDSLGLEVSHVEARTPAEQDEALRAYAAQGYDLVFAHGFEFQDAAERVSAQYPRTRFIITSGRRVQGNVAPLIFRLEEASYLAGMIAGGLTRTGLLGFVGGIELPPIEAAYQGWVNGAKAVNARVQSRKIYLNSFDDASAGPRGGPGAHEGRGRHVPPQRGRRGPRSLSGREGAPGRVRLRRERRPVARWRLTGCSAARSSTCHEPSSWWRKEVKAGTYRPKVEAFGLESGVVRYQPNPSLDSLVPATLKSRVKAAAD